MRRDLDLLAQVRREPYETDARPLDLDLIRRLFVFTRPYATQRRRLLALVLVRSVQLPLLGWAIGAVLAGPVRRFDAAGILLGAAGYFLLALSTQATFVYRMRYGLRLGEAVLHDLRRDLFRHLQRQPMAFFTDNRIGRLISRFTNDADAVRAGVQDVLFVSLVQAGQMTVAAIVMACYDWVLFLVLAAMAPLLWRLNVAFRRRLSGVHRAAQESFSRITAALAESVGGIRVTQGFARERTNADLFGELVADHASFNLDVAKASGSFLPLLELNNQFFVACLLSIGGWRVLHGLMRVEDLYQFVLMSSLFFSAIVQIGTQFNHALSAMAGAERVFRLLDTPPRWEDPPDAAPHTLVGRVVFRDVSFAYVPDRPVLHRVSFTAEPGQTVALVGHTGSGKSTIVNLLAKFYLPTEGELLLDGRDIRGISSLSLRRQLGIVPQQNFLFSGTVMENILLGRAGATGDEAVDAVRRLDCLDAIESLPDAFRTAIGERGAGISLGQRQLVCFARAMLADPRILILDEATSSIDAFTETRIQHALALLLRGRTSFVVAHRLSTIRHADLLLVLDRGRIVERGTHAQLLEAGGTYAGLYRQFVRAGQIRE
jgi:ATP-binding cassette subfamily B protein